MAAVNIQPPLSWVDQYDGLLAEPGLERASILSEAMPPNSGRGERLFSLADCLRKPSLMIDQIQRDYPEATHPRQIKARASVLHQDLALNVIAPLTLQLFRDRLAPIPEPDSIYLTMLPDSEPPPALTSRWVHISHGSTVDEWGFQRALSQLASDWYPAFRQGMGLSPGAYWSSMGLGLGAPFSAVWNRADPGSVSRLAQAWLRTFDNGASQFIDWICAEFSGQRCAIPQRRGCCLKYLLPDGGYCGTCGVYRKQRLAALSAERASPTS